MKTHETHRLGGIFAKAQAGSKRDTWKSRRYYLRTAQLSPEAAKGLAHMVAVFSRCEPEPSISRVIELLVANLDAASAKSFELVSHAEVEQALQRVAKVVDCSAKLRVATPLQTEAIA